MFTKYTIYFIIIYLLVLLIFYKYKNDINRFINILLLFILSYYLIGSDNILISILIGTLAVFQEMIFIFMFKNSWYYYQNNFFNVPYYLFPLWWLTCYFMFNRNKFISFL